MRIFLTGGSCVGGTTVGAKLAALPGCPFFDLDYEIESFFSMPIERLQDKFLTMYLKDARKLCRSFSLFKKQWFTSTI